jgi:thiamine biosynthesis lipoprotein
VVRARIGASVAGLIGLAACSPGASRAALSRAWPTMGTVFTATAWGQDSAALDRALDAAFDSVRRVDSLLSTYNPGSEIARINRGVGRGAWRVSQTFAAVLARALEVARLSNGAFDPTLHDWRGVRFDRTARRVGLEPGLRLDFGGIAKGYALDQARLALGGVADSGVLNLGGQVLILRRSGGRAVGRTGGPADRRSVGIVDPDDPERVIALIEVDSGSVSTSSQAERPGHIVDPRRGRGRGGPATRARSVTVVASTGIAADAWSTALFVLGCDSALAVAERVGGMGVVCVDRAVRWSPGLDGRVAARRLGG